MYFRTHSFYGASITSSGISVRFSSPLNPLGSTHEHGDLSFRFTWPCRTRKESLSVTAWTLRRPPSQWNRRFWVVEHERITMRAERGKGGTERSRSTSCEDCSRRLQRRMLVSGMHLPTWLFISHRARVRAQSFLRLKGATETTVGGVFAICLCTVIP